MAGALFKYGPATAMVVGAILLVLASSGTVPGADPAMNIQQSWQGLLAVAGLLSLLSGLVMGLLQVWPARTNDRDKNARLKYRLTIDGPPHGATLPRGWQEAHRTFKRQPPADSVWLFLQDGGGWWWPQSVATVGSRTWHGRFVMEGTSGTATALVLVAVGKDGEALCNYYVNVGQTTKRWFPLASLTSEMYEGVRTRYVRG